MFRFLSISRVLLLCVLSASVTPAVVLAADFSDPTRPSEYKAASKKSSLRLESILYGPDRKVAIINGKPLAEGDSIGSLTVVRIEKESVSLSNQKKLVLKRASIRQEN